MYHIFHNGRVSKLPISTAICSDAVLRFVGPGENIKSCSFSQLMERRLELAFAEAESKVLNSNSKLTVQVTSSSSLCLYRTCTSDHWGPSMPDDHSFSVAYFYTSLCNMMFSGGVNLCFGCQPMVASLADGVIQRTKYNGDIVLWSIFSYQTHFNHPHMVLIHG